MLLTTKLAQSHLTQCALCNQTNYHRKEIYLCKLLKLLQPQRINAFSEVFRNGNSNIQIDLY